jgi:hypothetical protein
LLRSPNWERSKRGDAHHVLAETTPELFAVKASDVHPFSAHSVIRSFVSFAKSPFAVFAFLAESLPKKANNYRFGTLVSGAPTMLDGDQTVILERFVENACHVL